MYLYGLLIPFLSFALQIWPRLINRYFGIDTWRHLLLADYVRKHHTIPTVLEEQYIRSSGNPGYPPIIYLILSLFPKNFTERFQFIFAPIFDAIQNYSIFYFAYLITNDILSSISAQVIATLTPIAVIEASNLSTRTLSYLIFSLSFFPLILFTTTHMYFWLFIAFVMLLVLFLTHKFAVQAYFFTTIGLSIIQRNPLYVLFFLSGFAFMYIFMSNIYRPILKEHLSILKFWNSNIQYRFIHQFRGDQKSKEVSDFVHRLFLLSTRNPYMYILGNNPWISIIFIGTIISFMQNAQIESTILNQNMLSKLHIWTYTSILIALFTLSVKRLRFLGEGNRYLEYSILPISIILGSYVPSFAHVYGTLFIAFTTFLLLGLTMSIVYIQIKVVLKDRMRTITPELWNCIAHLNKFEGKARIAIFPLQFGDALTYFIKGKVLTTYNNAGLANLSDIYPVVKIPIDKLIKKFDLNFILFDKNYVTLKELAITKYSIIKKDGGYILLKV